jgi:hypothetical protein
MVIGVGDAFPSAATALLVPVTVRMVVPRVSLAAPTTL